MPFGLKSAPNTFHRLMNSVFMGLIGTVNFIYLDDIIFGETLQEHHARLREVFQKLRQFKLKVEPDKCEVLKTELNYLGHVTSESVKPGPEKFKAIKNFPILKNTTDVKSFLGLAGYYRKSIPQFRRIAKPLTELLKRVKSGEGTQNR